MTEHSMPGWLRIARWIGGGFIAFAIGIFVAWQIGALNGVALWAAGRLLGYEISCARLSGNLLSSFTCADLSLADSKGRFLRADEFALAWNPLALLRNEVAVHRLDLTGSTLTRLPESNAPSSSGGVFPGIKISIDHLNIRRFLFARKNASRACIDLGGQGNVGPEGFDTALELTRCVPKNGQFRFSGRYLKSSGALELSLRGRDNGAIVSALTGAERVGDTSILFTGAGTIGAFTGDFRGYVSEIGSVSAAFRARDLRSTHVDASFDIAPSLLPSWAPHKRGTLIVDFARTPDNGLNIETSTLNWDDVVAHLQLMVSADGTLSGTSNFNTGKEITVSGIKFGSVQAQARVSGTRTSPSLVGQTSIANVGIGETGRIALLRADYSAELKPSGSATATLSAQTQTAVLPKLLQSLLGAHITLRASATRSAAGAITFDGSLAGSAAHLEAKADVARDRGTARLTIAVPDVSKADAGMSGRASASLALSRITLDGDLDGVLRVEGADMTQAGLGVALGRAPYLSADLHGHNGKYEVDNFRIDTAVVAVRGSASVASNGVIDATLKTTRGKLAPLSEMANRPFAGEFSFQARVSGTRSAPVIAIRADAPQAIIAGDKIKSISLRFDAQKQERWTANFSTKARTAGGTIDLTVDARTLQDGWRARVIKGNLGPATLSGFFAQSGRQYAGRMALEGRVLSPVSAITKIPMSGTGLIAVEGMGRRINASVSLENLAVGPLQKAKFQGRATMEGLDSPIRASLSLKDGENHVSAEIRGQMQPVAITLNSMSGRWSGADIALRAPATLTIGDGKFALERTTLGISTGEFVIVAKGSMDTLTASVELTGMPVAPLAAMAQLRKGTGTVNVMFTADLAPDKSVARLQVDAHDLAFATADKHAKPADVNFTAQWNGMNLTADGRISGLGHQDAILRVQVPVVRAVNSYMPKLAGSGPISAQLRAQLRVERLMALLPLAEETASGGLEASADISGDISDPKISGKITVTDGTFTEFRTSTRLANLNASVAASGGSKVVVQMSATDGASGTIKANGEFSMPRFGVLDAGRLDVTLHDAEIVREDLVRASVDGSVSIGLAAGTPPKISGKLRTRTVRIDIGAVIPKDIPQIDVTEVNDGTTILSSPPKAPPFFSEAALDVSVTLPNRIYVTGHGVDSEWNGDLKVTGTVGKPDVSGKFDLVRGQTDFVGKTFVLQEGRVMLRTTEPKYGTIHLTAQNESSDLTVTVALDGPLVDPTISWTSSPSLPKSEILSRLFFGTSTPHLTALQAFQLAQLSGQLGPFGQTGGGGLLLFARRITGLDVLRVEVPSDLSGTGGSITAGKYITDKIYVGVKQGADVYAGTAQVEVKVTPHIVIDAEAGANSQGSLGASWKWNY